MPTVTNNLYLDLLKKTLTDYLNIDSDVANAIPSEYWTRKSWLKNLRNRILVNWLKRSNMMALRRDGRTSNERRDERIKGNDMPSLAVTMVGLRRLDNLQKLIEDILSSGVPGDIIETGVWRGGASIFIRGVLKAHGVTDRKVWLCDSFEGLPAPEPEKYPDDKGFTLHTHDALSVSQQQVEDNFRRYELLDDQVCFVKGYFEDTLPTLEIGDLSLLRMDGDMYGSTIVTLDSLYDKVSVGGYIIVDDYVLDPCRKAIDSFRTARGIEDEIIRIDDCSVYWQKTG